MWPWVNRIFSTRTPWRSIASRMRGTSPPGSTTAARALASSHKSTQFCWNGVTGITATFRAVAESWCWSAIAGSGIQPANGLRSRQAARSAGRAPQLGDALRLASAGSLRFRLAPGRMVGVAAVDRGHADPATAAAGPIFGQHHAVDQRVRVSPGALRNKRQHRRNQAGAPAPVKAPEAVQTQLAGHATLCQTVDEGLIWLCAGRRIWASEALSPDRPRGRQLRGRSGRSARLPA